MGLVTVAFSHVVSRLRGAGVGGVAVSGVAREADIEKNLDPCRLKSATLQSGDEPSLLFAMHRFESVTFGCQTDSTALDGDCTALSGRISGLFVGCSGEGVKGAPLLKVKSDRGRLWVTDIVLGCP